MYKPIVAVVTGFTRNRQIAEMGLRPLLSLQKKGIIDRIVYVVGSDSSLDEYASYVSEMPGIETHRSEPFATEGMSRSLISILNQQKNLRLALDCVADADTLVIKSRPDFIIEESFLASKILNFETICAPSKIPELYPIAMPPPLFKRKVWIPWADANAFFFYDDIFFMGLKSDVENFTVVGPDTCLYLLNDEHHAKYNNFFHTWRHSAPFLDRYPMFRRYMENASLYRYDIPYRYHQIIFSANLHFFWVLLICHTWMLATHFHIDLGRNQQMKVYSTRQNEHADWSKLESLAIPAPFSNAEEWRRHAVPGGFLPFVSGAYARILDNRWLETIFTMTDLRDLSANAIRGSLQMISAYPQGVLAGAENQYYEAQAQFKHKFETEIEPELERKKKETP